MNKFVSVAIVGLVSAAAYAGGCDDVAVYCNGDPRVASYCSAAQIRCTDVRKSEKRARRTWEEGVQNYKNQDEQIFSECRKQMSVEQCNNMVRNLNKIGQQDSLWSKDKPETVMDKLRREEDELNQARRKDRLSELNKIPTGGLNTTKKFTIENKEGQKCITNHIDKNGLGNTNSSDGKKFMALSGESVLYVHKTGSWLSAGEAYSLDDLREAKSIGGGKYKVTLRNGTTWDTTTNEGTFIKACRIQDRSACASLVKLSLKCLGTGGARYEYEREVSLDSPNSYDSMVSMSAAE